jgi:hypothetical protein
VSAVLPKRSSTKQSRVSKKRFNTLFQLFSKLPPTLFFSGCGKM